MPTADEYSSEGAEIVVAYFSRQLGEFRTPKSWSTAVGSGPDLSAATMTELLERSVVAAEEDKASTNESNCDENFPNYHTMSYCTIFDLRDIMQQHGHTPCCTLVNVYKGQVIKGTYTQFISSGTP